MVQLLALLCVLTQLSISKGFAFNAFKNIQSKPLSSQAVSNTADIGNEREQAVVVGGGPVGLSAALVLANRGYDVTLFEATPTKEIKTFNPALAYLYNINERGQVFTKMFPNIHEKLVERSVASDETGFFIAPGDVKKKIETPKVPSIGGARSYWIPRHTMTVLLWDVVDEHNKSRNDNSPVGKIAYEQGVNCVSVCPINNGGISVAVKNKSTGEEKIVEGKLVVGADGIRSKVRECLKERTGLFGTWRYNEKKFKIKKWVSPATGLKLKALQFPTDRYSIMDADGSKIATRNKDFVVVRGKLDGPLNFLTLGSLPVIDSDSIRPANCIARPNHVLWTLQTGEAMKTWFKDNYPRIDFDRLVPDEEWERFAKADALSFPPCQYSPGLQASSDGGECGVVLLGDAAHAFSPDIGQGINAGLMDVVQFDEFLSKSKTGNLGEVLKQYEYVRAPETRALIRLARFGSPYQYNQPLRRDRLGKKLWTANVALRVILNKITLGIFPKPMIFNASNTSISYRKLVRQADLGTATLMSILAFSLFKIMSRCNFL